MAELNATIVIDATEARKYVNDVVNQNGYLLLTKEEAQLLSSILKGWYLPSTQAVVDKIHKVAAR